MRYFGVYLLSLIFVITTALVGCGPRTVDTYDRERFLIVSEYVDQIIPAIESVKFDYDQWARDYANLEPLEWLEVSMEIIANANDRYLNDTFPTPAEIAEWTIPVSRDGREWVLEGRDLAPPVEALITNTTVMVDILSQMIKMGEEINEADIRQFVAALEIAYESSETLRQLFYDPEF